MFGLTPSIAAAAFVRMAPMLHVSGFRAPRAQRRQRSLHARTFACSGRRPPAGADGPAEVRLRMLLPSPRTISAARGGPHGPIRAQKRMPYSSVGRRTTSCTSPSPRAAWTKVHEVAGAGRLGVGRHEQLVDVAVDRLGLVDAEQLLGQRGHAADRERRVDEQERVAPGAGASSAGAPMSSPRSQRAADARRRRGDVDRGGAAAVAAEGRRRGRVGEAGERDELRAPRSCVGPPPPRHERRLVMRRGRARRRARPSSRSRIWRCASPGDSASWRAGGAAALDAAAAEERHRQRAGGRAHAVGPAGDLVVGAPRRRRRRRPAARRRAARRRGRRRR